MEAEEDFRLSSLQENGDEGDDGSVIAIWLLLFRAALALLLVLWVLFLFRECFRRRRGDALGGGGGELIEREGCDEGMVEVVCYPSSLKWGRGCVSRLITLDSDVCIPDIR